MSDQDNKQNVVGTEVSAVQPQPVPTPFAGNSPDALIALAIQHGSAIDAIERLVALRDKQNAEVARNAYNAAMSHFQSECPTVEKKKEAKDGRGVVMYKFATLENIVEAVAPLLSRHGFSYTFKNDQTEKDIIEVSCVVTHALGHSETTTFKVPTSGGTSMMSAPQKIASALTFAKRYTFTGAFGIVSGDEDKDGKREEGTREDAPTDEQRAEIDELVTKLGMTKAEFTQRVRAKYKVSVTTITRLQAEGIIKSLRELAKKVGANVPA